MTKTPDFAKMTVDESVKSYYYDRERGCAPSEKITNIFGPSAFLSLPHITYCIPILAPAPTGPKFKEDTRHEQFSCKRKSSGYVPGNV